MLEKFIANLLASYLGRYIENLDQNHVKVSIWSGNVTLHNLKIKKSALSALRLPIRVKEGVLGELKVVIPWSRLRSEPVKIEIKNVLLIVHPNKAEGYQQSEEMEAEFKEKLDDLEVFEAIRRGVAVKKSETGSGDAKRNKEKNDAAATKNDDELDDVFSLEDETAPGYTQRLEKAKDSSFVSRLKGSMMQNVQLGLENVTIQYEDLVNDPAHPVAFTLHFQSFSVQSCNKHYDPFFAGAADDFYYKLVKLLRTSITIEQLPVEMVKQGGRSCAMVSQASHLPTESNPNKREEMSSANITNQKRGYLCHPFDISLKLQHQPIPRQPHVPRWIASATVHDQQVQLSRTEWDAVWRSVRYVQRHSELSEFRRYRPPPGSWIVENQQRNSSNVLLWWQFAIQSVLSVVKKNRSKGKFSFVAYKVAKQQQGARSVGR